MFTSKHRISFFGYCVFQNQFSKFLNWTFYILRLITIHIKQYLLLLKGMKLKYLRFEFFNKTITFETKHCFIHFFPGYLSLKLRNWVFATNSDFTIAISLQPDGINLWYFKLSLLDLKWFIVWNIKGPRHWNAKI